MHVSDLCKRINKFVYAIYQIRNVTDRRTAILSYQAYIESIIRYAIVIWGNSTDKNKVFISQKKCIRAINGISPRNSCEPYFKNLALLPLPCLYIYEVCNFVTRHKNLFGKTYDLTNTRVRRNPHRLNLKENPKSSKFNKSTLAMCVKVYNQIPNDIKKYNLPLFKRHLFRWLNHHNFYSLEDFFKFKKGI